MREVWKDIYFVDEGITYDYRGLYQISNLGRIKSLLFRNRQTTIKREQILKSIKTSKGYLVVRLYKNGKNKIFLVHRLVGKIFIPNPNNLPVIHHKNEDKTCNIVNLDDLYGKTTNLEWCTQGDNIRYSQARRVNQYDKQGNFIKSWDCIMNIERKLKINNTHIGQCCKGKQKTAGGYIWKYEDAS